VKVLTALHELWDVEPSKSTGYPATAAAIVYNISPPPSSGHTLPGLRRQDEILLYMGKAARQ